MPLVMFVSAIRSYTVLSSIWLKSLDSCAVLERKTESRRRPYSFIGFKGAGETLEKVKRSPDQESRSLSGSSCAVPASSDASTGNLCRRLLEAKRQEESWRLGYCNCTFSRVFLLNPISGRININMKSKGDSSQRKT